MQAIATNFMARAIRPALAVALCLCVSVTADAGNGFIVVDLDGNSQDGSVALSRADDGTLLVLANSQSDPSSLVAHGILAFDPTGLAVSSFGSNGYASLEQPSPVALANRPDGVLVTTGGSSASLVSPTGQIQKLVGLPSDSPGSGAMFGQAVAALDDNRVIVGGGYGQGGQSDTWALARFNTDGSLDTTFDGSGWRRKDASPSVRIDSVHVLPDGSSLAAGAGTNAAVIGRFNADGTTDFTFGTNGLVTLPNCIPICQRALLAVDASGRIYTEGGANALIRLNPGGSIDGSYASVPIAPDLVVVGIAIDSAGRVVLFGTLLVNTAGYIARFLPSGARDTSFGVDGEAIFRPGSGPSNSVLRAGLIQPDDKPVALMTIEGERDGEPGYGPFDIGLFRFTAGGVLDTSFGADHVDSDVYPDAFAFTSNAAPFGTMSVVSNVVSIEGINGPTSVSLQQTAAGSGYSIGCTGLFVTDYGKILPGQSLCVRHSASLQPGGTAETTVNVGGRSATYTTVSTSVAADTVPDGYSFTDQIDVAPGTAVTSNTVTVTGLTGAAPIAVENGMYSIGCDPLRFVSSNGFITDGQTICVQHIASSQFNTTTRTTLAIGGVTDTFSSTTATADTTPNAFAFPAVSGVTPGGTVVSTAVVISGINAPTPVSVVTGEFSIGCVTGWTSAPGTILPGHTICVRHTAATQASSSVTTTLTIGGVSSGFTSTTAMQASHGGGGGGGFSYRELLGLLALFLVRAGVTARRTSTLA